MPDINIQPLPVSARFTLRLPISLVLEVGQVAGFRLDTAINTCVVVGEHMMARLGPDEWLLLGPAGESDAIQHSVTSALGGRFFSLVDVAHRDLGFVVKGDHARDVISGGCPLDLDDAAFPPGSATRTLLGKAAIVLMRSDSAHCYRVECGRSFAPYVRAFLDDIAREFTAG